MMKSKKLLSAILALVLCLSLVACGGNGANTSNNTSNNTGSDAPEKVMYVALCNDETGANQAVGKRKRDGTEFAVKKINEAGGILGHRVELLIYDTATEMQTNINAVKLALEDERISALMMPSTTSYAVAVLPDISAKEVPFLPIGSGISLAEAKNPYTWQLRALSTNADPALVNYGIDTLGIKNPAILNLTQEVNIESGRNMRKHIQSKGIEVPDSRCFAVAADETNFAPVVAQIAASGADGLFTGLSENTVMTLAKAMADAGLDIPVLGNSTLADASVLSNVANEVEGWYTTAEYNSNDPREYVQNFNEEFIAEYGYAPAVSAALQYDIVNLLKAACEAGGSATDRAKINEGFTKIENLECLIGIASYHDDHSFMGTINIGQVKDGALKLVDTVSFR